MSDKVKQVKLVEIEIVKPIIIPSVGKGLLKPEDTCKVPDSAAEIYISKGYAKALKAPKPVKVSAEDAVKAINEAKTKDDLTPFSDDKRATVKKAYDAKLKSFEDNK